MTTANAPHAHANTEFRTKFTDDVLHLLTTRGAHVHKPSGTNAGELSMSDLADCLRHGDGIKRRYQNIRISGRGQTLEDLLKGCGFTVLERKAGRSVRRYVTV
jgi:hypothetical protein